LYKGEPRPPNTFYLLRGVYWFSFIYFFVSSFPSLSISCKDKERMGRRRRRRKRRGKNIKPTR
jgi:hypothetical protein